MTHNEFKAWFDGFSQGIGDTPTAEQWAIVKAKVAEFASPLSGLSFPPNVRGVGVSGPMYPVSGSSGDVPPYGLGGNGISLRNGQ